MRKGLGCQTRTSPPSRLISQCFMAVWTSSASEPPAGCAGVLRQQGGTHQARTERKVFSLQYSQQIAQLDAAENGLCFGRLDFTDGERRYIGRIGIFDDSDDYEQLLMDWRAPRPRPVLPGDRAPPGGRPAPPAHRDPRPRSSTGLDDEILDLDRLGRRGPPRRARPARRRCWPRCTASRTGRMGDIVATIQAEQDRIIRADPRRRAGRAGRPGHRQDRRRAAPRRLSAVHPPRPAGPARRAGRRARTRRSSATSARCCPRSARPACCCPPSAGCSPGSPRARAEAPEVAEVKGRPAMAERHRQRAVRDRQARPPDAAGRARRVDRDSRCARPQAAARRRAATGPGGPARPHNQARSVFVRETSSTAGRRAGRGPARARTCSAARTCSSDGDLAAIRDEVARGAGGPRALVDGLWPLLTPQRLLADLFADRGRLGRRGARADRRGPGAAAARAAGARLDAGRRAAARRGGRAARRGRPRSAGPRPSARAASVRATPRACSTCCIGSRSTTGRGRARRA